MNVYMYLSLNFIDINYICVNILLDRTEKRWFKSRKEGQKLEDHLELQKVAKRGNKLLELSHYYCKT